MAERREHISIIALLKEPRQLDKATVQQAAECAFRDAPRKPQVIAIQNRPGFGVVLGPLRLAVINADQPYFRDATATANRVSHFPGRIAIQEHKAWLAIDLLGEPPPIDPPKLYGLIGSLLAEFLDPNVLGLIRAPDGRVIGYDFSFIPLFRTRKAFDAFEKGTPDRIVKVPAKSDELAAAAAEARRRWPEFVAAFADRYKGQGFGVKKMFIDGDLVEHMWVNVTTIAGTQIQGWLSNEPRIIKSLKLRDAVTLTHNEVEDWIFTNGTENVGGFQARVLRRN